MERLKRFRAAFGSLAAVGTPHTALRPVFPKPSQRHASSEVASHSLENIRSGTDLDEYGIWRASCSGSLATHWSALK